MAREKQSRSCLGNGCLAVGVLMLILAVAVGWVLAVQAGMLERLGLRESLAEELLSGTPDRQAAEALREELHRADINTRGVRFYVLPIEGTDGNLVYAIIDRSQGFVPWQTAEPRVALKRLQCVILGDTLERLRIRRVAVDFRNKKGETVLTLTALGEDMKAFAEDTTDRKALLKAVDGRVNLIKLVAGLREVLP